MLQIETKEIKINDELKMKFEMFTNTRSIIKNGSIRNIKGTNIIYVELNQIFKKNNILLKYMI